MPRQIPASRKRAPHDDSVRRSTATAYWVLPRNTRHVASPIIVVHVGRHRTSIVGGDAEIAPCRTDIARFLWIGTKRPAARGRRRGEALDTFRRTPGTKLIRFQIRRAMGRNQERRLRQRSLNGSGDIAVYFTVLVIEACPR
jgi:hypothetical protein